MRRTIILIIRLLCIVLVAALGYLVWTAPVIRIEYADVATVEQHQYQWQASAIANYQMTIDYRTWGADLRMHITVENDKVVAADCDEPGISGPCDGFDPNEFTISSLFTKAHKLSTLAEPIIRSDHSNQSHPFSVGFNSTYHFPQIMVSGLGEATQWEVRSFTVSQ